MPARLYAVPASHPCAVVERALELKGIAYDRIDVAPVLHKPIGRMLYGATTVPGLKLEDGRKLAGSRTILRELERMVPDPPLLPKGDDDLSHRVEEAEEWGDEVLQPLVRRVLWCALSRDASDFASYSAGAKLRPPTPAFMTKLSAPAITRAERRIHGATDAVVRTDLRSLPALLDRVEDWIDRGVLGSGTLNAADLQVASGLRLLSTVEDVGPLLDRPAGEFAKRVFPAYPGRTPKGALPSDWFPSATPAAAA